LKPALWVHNVTDVDLLTVVRDSLLDDSVDWAMVRTLLDISCDDFCKWGVETVTISPSCMFDSQNQLFISMLHKM